MTNYSGSESGGPLRLDRRTVLKAVGAGLFATGFGGSASAQERFPPGERTHWGKPRRVGNGVISAFLTLSESDEPRFLGYWFTESALNGLPDEREHGQQDTTVPLPAAADSVNVEWATVGWNPHGHGPEDVYDVPHFDFHLYFVEQAEIEQELPAGECDADDDGTVDFGVSCDVYDRATKPLPDAQRPPGYLPTGDVVPFMGNHWAEVGAPEFQDDSFTHTYIYGSFDGELNFVEPMVSRKFLSNLDGREVSEVETPEAFPEAGFYPTQYEIRHLGEQSAYAVFLSRFRQFDST